MTDDFDQIDFFSDPSLVDDPYPYFEYLRAKCPVTPIPHHGVVAVTGYEEACDIYRDISTFSSCNSSVGPFAAFPVPLEGDDISPIIEQYRDRLPLFDHMVTMDPPDHTRERALLMRMITPKRLQENEDFMWRLADQQLDEFTADGRCEFIRDYSQPFAMLVVADLLGVPESDFQQFRQGFRLGSRFGSTSDHEQHGDLNPLSWLDDYFAGYVEERRAEPRADVLTDLALAKYPDGSTPPVTAVVRIATFLFAAGQETTARLLGAALKYLAAHPEVQDELREHRDRIPMFVEETLRLESPVKADFRLARRATTVGGVEIEAGTPVMMLSGAANRDPSHFECPGEVQLDRVNSRDHIAFGRGHHSCPGAPLARAEGMISLERILDRMQDIRFSEEHHGPASDRRFAYEPTWVLRGLHNLHLEFTPVG